MGILRSGGSLRAAGMDMIREVEVDILRDERWIFYMGMIRSARGRRGGSDLRIRGRSVICRRDGSVSARIVDL